MMKKWLPWFEQIFTIIALTHFSEGILPLILSGGVSEGDVDIVETSHPLNAGVFVLIYFITYILLFLRWRKLTYTLSKNKFLWGLMAIVICSFLWSLYPTNTFIESVRVISSSSFGLYFATRYTLKEQLKILSSVFMVAVFASIVFVVLPPHYGIMGGIHAGAWRGIYVHKNLFGLIMAIASVSFLIQAIDTRKLRFKLLLPLALLLVLLSRSTGALGVALAANTMFFFYYGYVSLRLKLVFLIPTLLLLVNLLLGSGYWFINNLQTVASATGEDLTLTGRTIFWQILINMVFQRPLFGYGYKGFWYGLEGPSRDVIQVAMWTVPEAHNGFLELALSTGLVGMTFFICGYLVTMARAVQWIHLNQSPLALWPLVFLNIMIVCNLTESSLMEFGFLWLIYSSIAFSLPLNLRIFQRDPTYQSLERKPLPCPDEMSCPIEVPSAPG
jgi:exopolysaccharide production protein ExoQ